MLTVSTAGGQLLGKFVQGATSYRVNSVAHLATGQNGHLLISVCVTVGGQYLYESAGGQSLSRVSVDVVTQSSGQRVE